jgi:hypothetical protein
MSKMRHTRKNTKKAQFKSKYKGNSISCPICGAEVVKVDIEQDIADIFLIPAGLKYVCSAKFIYRSNTSDLQFSKCYGVPVEGALRMLQLDKPFEKEDIIALAQQRLTRDYINKVIANDPFFTKISKYCPKQIESVPIKDAEEIKSDVLDEIDELRGLDDE